MQAGLGLAGSPQQVLPLNTGCGAFGRFTQATGLRRKALL
jgi:hypothetical protein